jgi:hypothetical protein
MIRRDFSRRALISRFGQGAAATALWPLLDATRGLAAPLYPKRLIIVVWPRQAG